MDDATHRALQAAVKALSEVVTPAVDKGDALAVDQLRLVISWLQFHDQRRADERRLAQAKLRLRVALATDAIGVLGAADRRDLLGALSDERDAARALLGVTDAPADSWRIAGEALDARVGEAIDALADGPAAARDALARVVLAHARNDLMLHRAWFAPFGFEARPEAVLPLEQLLARGA